MFWQPAYLLPLLMTNQGIPCCRTLAKVILGTNKGHAGFKLSRTRCLQIQTSHPTEPISCASPDLGCRYFAYQTVATNQRQRMALATNQMWHWMKKISNVYFIQTPPTFAVGVHFVSSTWQWRKQKVWCSAERMDGFNEANRRVFERHACPIGFTGVPPSPFLPSLARM